MENFLKRCFEIIEKQILFIVRLIAIAALEIESCLDLIGKKLFQK